MQEFDYEAAVEVRFFEDLTYDDVAPILDSFARTPVFNVRASRDAWSGPAAGGPEIGLIITAAAATVATAGGVAFVTSFFSELGKDTYRGVRSMILTVVRKLRDKEPDRRRAVIGLSIHVRDVSVCFGPLLESEARDDEWTDEWFLERLREAQELLDRHDADSDRQPGDRDCEHWLK